MLITRCLLYEVENRKSYLMLFLYALFLWKTHQFFNPTKWQLNSKEKNIRKICNFSFLVVPVICKCCCYFCILFCFQWKKKKTIVKTDFLALAKVFLNVSDNNTIILLPTNLFIVVFLCIIFDNFIAFT